MKRRLSKFLKVFLLPSSAENTQQHQEQVNEIKIKG
jgi:hypothetical protein